MRTKTCPYCGYKWTPRKHNPKCCPRCRRYLPTKKSTSQAKNSIYKGDEALLQISQILKEEKNKVKKKKQIPNVLILSQEEEPDENQRLEEGKKIKIRRPLSLVLR